MALSMPNITPAQIIALLAGGAGPVCVLFGVDLNVDQESAIDRLRELGLGLFAADAVIRHGRTKIAAAKITAAAAVETAELEPAAQSRRSDGRFGPKAG